MSTQEFNAIRKVGGIASLSRLEHDVLAVVLGWKPGRDKWRYGKREDIARVLHVSVRSVTRALSGLAHKAGLGLARWKFGICVLPPVAVRVVGAVVMRGLVEAKRSRERMRRVRPQLWEVAQKLWQNCQCGQNGRTIYASSKIKNQEGLVNTSSASSLGVSALDAAIASGLRARGIA